MCTDEFLVLIYEFLRPVFKLVEETHDDDPSLDVTMISSRLPYEEMYLPAMLQSDTQW